MRFMQESILQYLIILLRYCKSFIVKVKLYFHKNFLQAFSFSMNLYRYSFYWQVLLCVNNF